MNFDLDEKEHSLEFQFIQSPKRTTVFVPTVIGGLVLWLKTDSITANDGNPITTWNDSSANGNNVTRIVDDSWRPIYKTNIQNGRPVLRFNGSNQAMKTAPAFTAVAQPYTLFIVWKWFNTSGSHIGLDGMDPSHVLIVRQFWDAPLAWRIDTGNSDSGTAAPCDTNWNIWDLRKSGGTGGLPLLSINNAADATYDRAGDHAITGFTIGSSRNGTAAAQIDVGELLFYSGTLSVSDRARVVTYLNGRWACFV